MECLAIREPTGADTDVMKYYLHISSAVLGTLKLLGSHSDRMTG